MIIAENRTFFHPIERGPEILFRIAGTNAMPIEYNRSGKYRGKKQGRPISALGSRNPGCGVRGIRSVRHAKRLSLVNDSQRKLNRRQLAPLQKRLYGG